MKTLYLIRHAQAEPGGPQMADRDRPLSPHGQRDATAMGHRLRAAGHVPQSLVCSPALRTWQTARALADALGLPTTAVAVEDSLYASAPEQLLAVARRTAETADSVALVGHNPECSELLGRFEPGAQGMPPGAVALLEFDVPGWAELGLLRPLRVLLQLPGE